MKDTRVVSTEELHLIELLLEEMHSDTDGGFKQSQILERLYNETDEKGRRLLNEAFMCLCGWCYDTLLNELKDRLTYI